MIGGEPDRTVALVNDIRGLLHDATRITDRGRGAFFNPDDRTQRLAAKAIVIDLQTAAERLPQTFRASHPDVAWSELRATRNYLARDYSNTDYYIIWNALLNDFPRMFGGLGIG